MNEQPKTNRLEQSFSAALAGHVHEELPDSEATWYQLLTRLGMDGPEADYAAIVLEAVPDIIALLETVQEIATILRMGESTKMLGRRLDAALGALNARVSA